MAKRKNDMLKALRASETRYRRLFEAAQDGILILNAETGMIDDVNPFLVKLLGLSREQFLGKQLWELGFFKDIAANQASFAELQEKGYVRYDDLPMKTAGGRRIEVEFVSNVYPVNHHKVIQCNIRDITERAQAKGRLRLMADILDVEPTSVVVHDADGGILYGNRKAYELHGYSPEEFLRLNLRDLLSVEARELMPARLRQVYESGQACYEVSHLRKDGSTFPLRVHARTAEWEGRPVILSVQTDLTERTQMENQLRQAQKLEAIGLLAGGVAHDFNNILMAQLGYCELMKSSLRDEDPLARDLAQIRACAERAAALTHQLLAFSRKQPLQLEVLDLNRVVTGIGTMLRRLIGEDVDFATVLAPELGRVRADPGQIEQVITNLAVNAREAMPHGGKLTIETANVDLDAEYARSHVSVVPGRYVMLAVSDTGSGMDEATQSRVFEPFFTTKVRGQGSGLGLATIYGIVKQSGGNIWVYSEPGKGTSFKIYLPRVEAEPTPQVRDEPTCARGGGEQVLVVEDELTIRELLQRMLAGLGYCARVAANGGEALIAVEEEQLKPDLLITDVVMPGMSGKVLAERLRKTQPDLKVLYMSGYTDDAIVHHGALDSGTPFLQKPFNTNDLAAKVHKLLGSG
jgi:PAS domain S-box-containing protein